ncbi:Fe-S protein assembly co-chaperone HscB [Pasteurella atlantica]|uniref:Fe-S protein assembly co-chaperone HscB n=1 Tax=Pasteurellaceae TaxID=712 RepID=UPI002749882F|nr:Fe-S protein assembly co-chaperone HscB [Pasteurella atlantica]MDP8034024.1 Fe-S protein assembly co-chaperone HscB [Pasteurella atlantica]MDP8035945.1 Fe-S protein assembly co-chaperone HscB [Pasteurella atlantica]MDP8037895.1 Fe-S protein assembly co-chaperone HscB [Pasteurella atlantica]MDP8048247.1 Fe-S protein assembly co-chaperone HscB [Pasteurella atlantica]MDP8050002.1 Fe-S protein assembly co-chaperone HscB [Pasteurella atlantica]
MNNPFELFDLAVKFEIDNAKLSANYLALQKALHPDNFATGTAQEQRQAMQKSAQLNDALQTLKDPILRAEAIIEIATGKAENIEQKSNNDIEFLMQQMQWRETLEQIEIAKNEENLTAFTAEIEQQNKEILNQLTETLANEQWQHAKALCDKLRFIKKLNVEIERVEEIIFEL